MRPDPDAQRMTALTENAQPSLKVERLRLSINSSANCGVNCLADNRFSGMRGCETTLAMEGSLRYMVIQTAQSRLSFRYKGWSTLVHKCPAIR